MRQACQRGSVSACSLLEETQRHESLEPICKAGQVQACLELAEVYLREPCSTGDRARALELLEGACNQKKASACTRLGELFGEGRSVGLDLERAITLFERAAALGETGAGIRWARTLRANRVGCDKGQGKDCVALAETCGEIYRRGEEPPESLLLLIFDARRKGCDSGLSSECIHAASMRFNGLGAAPDRSAALSSVRAHCLAAPAQCVQFAQQLTEDPSSGPEAGPLFEKACEAGNVEACAWLGRAYSEGLWGMKQDAAAAAKVLRRAETLGGR
ncbi:MAG: sel1 repeat family protein [Deltaproteobacteria bacterium]|nr:sel1 repeat family protein [Deltaproteobacteria bacterium]